MSPQRVPAAGRLVRETDFLSIVSHELRTPITVIVGLAATLANRRHDLTEEQIDGSLEQIRVQGERMATIVANLLDLSQLETGRFRVTLAPVELIRAAELALEAAPPPQGTLVNLEVPSDLWVIADSGRLQQVLIHLLTNAYRYGGETVELEAQLRGDAVLVTVSDDGEGVPADLVPELFQKYSHAKTSEGNGGAGLGLAIVRALVDTFGGRVWYESRRPSGARFNVLLPLAARNEIPNGVAEASAARAT
jgi:signal transduction histidine kinase